MKKLFQSLPFRLLAGVVIGILAGLTANETFMNIIVTLKQVMGQIITFCVPLIIIGFIACVTASYLEPLQNGDQVDIHWAEER